MKEVKENIYIQCIYIYFTVALHNSFSIVYSNSSSIVMLLLLYDSRYAFYCSREISISVGALPLINLPRRITLSMLAEEYIVLL